MQACVDTVTLTGLDPHLVRVEVDSGRGLPSFQLVGLPEASVRESRVRVRAALRTLDVDLNEYVVTVNLAPGYLKKTGSSFDLAIATAILVALGLVPARATDNTLLLGELALNGELRTVRGILPCLMGARQHGFSRAIVPWVNSNEASAVTGVETLAAHDLSEVVAGLVGRVKLKPCAASPRPSSDHHELVDLADVRGQHAARRALEIAASGCHNLLMMGPPGAGKTMLAARLPTIVPPLETEEALTVSALHSIAGVLAPGSALVRSRPFRAPHHTITSAAMFGGGSPVRPGEISLAHHGCLFLDELLEFPRAVIEGMRQPLESGEVTICRAQSRATFPARPMVVAAVNPCPCGYAGDDRRRCACSPQRIKRYRERLSGPMADRLDLHLVLPAVTLEHLESNVAGEPSEAVRARVGIARDRQLARRRTGETVESNNAALSGDGLQRVAQPNDKGRALLHQAVRSLGLSARSYTKILRVARTIADLDGATAITSPHVAEAIQMRLFDRAPTRAAA